MIGFTFGLSTASVQTQRLGFECWTCVPQPCRARPPAPGGLPRLSTCRVVSSRSRDSLFLPFQSRRLCFLLLPECPGTSAHCWVGWWDGQPVLPVRVMFSSRTFPSTPDLLSVLLWRVLEFVRCLFCVCRDNRDFFLTDVCCVTGVGF